MKESKRIEKVEQTLRRAIECALEEGVTAEKGGLGIYAQQGRWVAFDDVAPAVCAIGALLYGRMWRSILEAPEDQAAAILGISARQVCKIENGFDGDVVGEPDEYTDLGARLRCDYCLADEVV